MRTLLAYLAAGKAPEEIDADFPSVSPDALRAVIAFRFGNEGSATLP